MINKFTSFLAGICLCLAGTTVSLHAQQITPTKIPLAPPVVVNFTERAQFELAHPPKKVRRYIEQGEDMEKNLKLPPKAVSGGAINLSLPPKPKNGGEQLQSVSPSPSVSFNGVMDNGTLIPPDIEGAVGPTYVMESTNQQFNVYTKTGALQSTVSIPTLFASTGGSGYFDPHIIYDPSGGRFIIAMDGTYSNGDGGIFIAVSQTNDPTGSWYVSAFDGIGNKTNFLDFPEVGYNTNWIVVTANDFLTSNSAVAKVFVLNRAELYSGTASAVSSFTDNNSYSMTPAQTLDNTQTTEFIVQDWNGSSNGNGYMNIGTITGPVGSPVYSFGNNLGINSPWSETVVAAPQSGGNTIENGDTRVSGNVTYLNGSLWFAHTVFLPATTPTHSAVDWWQINPVYPFTIQQFGRVEDATGKIFYYYASINANSAGDALLGYCQSSSTTFASASYSFHAAADAASTMETGNLYKAGVANYFKEYGGGRNRWGDFTGTAVDPSNNSFWNFNEWANTSNDWGTAIANVPASAGAPTCNAPTGLSTTNVTTSSATYNWGAVSGASSYNVQYRVVGTSTWSTGTSSTTYFNASGLTASSNYEWQVQTVCTVGGSSGFTASTDFTTLAPPCNAATGLNTTNVTTSIATFNWGDVSGASSYNVQYRIIGTSTWSTGTSATNSFNASGLTASSNYEWQVQTVCTVGGSSTFTASTDFTTASPACNAPTTSGTTNITTSTATFNWGAVTGAGSYNVQYRIVGTSTLSTGTSGTTSFNASGLTASSNYEWQVQTVCSGGGSSAFTASTDFSTLAPPCNTPAGLSTTNISATTATFNWGAVSGALSYNVQYRIVGTTTWSTGSSTTTSFNASGLTASSNYEWQVQTVCSGGSGSSAFTASTDFTTATPPCNVPTGLGAGSITGSGATLTWGTVSGFVSYTLQWKLTSGSTWTSVTGLVTNSYPLSGLASCSAYQFEVLTVCASGSSAFSTAGSFTTTGCAVTYCTSKGTNTTRGYINNVKLGTINNTSGNNGGYANYTSLSTSLTGGSTYTISLTPGFTGSSYKEYWNVWIDYNHNGVFTDAGEKVATGNSKGALNLSFKVPTTALNGATRIRIQMEYNSYPGSSCATYTYGEVEDYTVNITGNTQSPHSDEINQGSPIESVTGIKLYPNPAQNNLTIEFPSQQHGNAVVNVFDVLGNKVITQGFALAEGANTLNINTAILTRGIYIFEIENNGDVQRQKFMIER